MERRATIRNGSNLCVNIPRVIEKTLNLVKGQIIEINEKEGDIVLHPIDKVRIIQEIQK